MTTFRKSADEEIAAICNMRIKGAPIVEIAAHFGRSTSAIDYVLRQAGVRIKTASAHAAGVKGDAIGDPSFERRRDADAEACALHLRDLHRGYPAGVPWTSLPVSHETRQVRFSAPTPFSMVGSPAAMCEG